MGQWSRGVCRRILQNLHDAEDAFQATFLVLARKASRLRAPATLGSWLYGVAYRTALHARAAALKRRTKEAAVVPASAGTEDAATDLRLALDREIQCLPDKYRIAIVLCDLEGKTRKQAARRLGWPEGTVASRLMTARRMLAKRLTRGGFGLSGAGVAAALSQNVSAGVPVPLSSATIKAATLFAASPAVISTIMPLNVAALAQGVMNAMWMTKAKTVAALALVLVALVWGGTSGIGLIGPTEAEQPNKGQPTQPQAERNRAGSRRATAAELRAAENEVETKKAELELIQAQLQLAQAALERIRGKLLPEGFRKISVQLTEKLPKDVALGARVDLIMELKGATQSNIVLPNLSVFGVNQEGAKDEVTLAVSVPQQNTILLARKEGAGFRINFHSRSPGTLKRAKGDAEPESKQGGRQAANEGHAGLIERIRPGDHLSITVKETPPGQPIQGIYRVEASGAVPLGFSYGRVLVKGMTLEQAEQAIRNNLRRILRDPIVSVIQADTSAEALEARLAKLEKAVREIQKSVDTFRKR